MSGLRVANPTEVIHGGGVALACELDGSVWADARHGLFAADTRVLSTYRLALGGVGLELLSRTRQGHGMAGWEYQNRPFRGFHGEVPSGMISVSLRRRVDGAMHDDIRIVSFARGAVRTTLTILLDADFADVFEVKREQLPPRLGVDRIITSDGITLAYVSRGFRRALHVDVQCSGAAPALIGSRLEFELDLEHGTSWTACLALEPEIDNRRLTFCGDPHAPEACDPHPVDVSCDDVLRDPFVRGVSDLLSLVNGSGDGAFVAAGVPWFLTLFGRDTLMTSLMTGLVSSTSLPTSLAAVGSLQATEVDDWRDAQPGKLPHEMRRGELAYRHQIPHTPYYGTHDAQSLYCLALWNAWRWTGDRHLLVEHFTTAEAAMRWCDEYGDEDGDGLQEYRTRSRDGYYNQGWKDAWDAIVDEDGRMGELPLATVELQGYVYAARLAMAELHDELGHGTEAGELRARAAELADLVEQRYFLADEGLYALALDGGKRPLRTIASNAGHLLWCGLPSPERAAEVVARLVRPDMNSGWGLRTLSNRHPSYNALSYQLGSVWPHDTALAAAGMCRYGFRNEAAVLARGMLEAAVCFEDDRLPELFAGFDRTDGPPVPYALANVPQAWAAAAPVLVTQLLLGLVPDAPRRRCSLSPWLPEWLPRLRLSGVTVGEGSFDIELSRVGATTTVEDLVVDHVDVELEDVEAPLWGRPVTGLAR